MARRKKSSERHHKELYGILFLALGVFFGLCLLSYNPADPAFNSASNIEQMSNLGGIVGAYLADILFTILGISAYVLCGALILVSAMQFMGKTIKIKWSEAIAYTLLVVAAATVVHLRFEVVHVSGQPISGGGLIGSLLGVVLQKYLGMTGAYIASTVLFITAFFYATHISVKTLLSILKESFLFIVMNIARGIVLLGRGIALGATHLWPLVTDGFYWVVDSISDLREKMKSRKRVKISSPKPSRPKTTAIRLAEQKPIKPLPTKEAASKPAAPETDPKIYSRADAHKKVLNSQLELAHMSKDYAYPPLSLLDSNEGVKVEIDEESLKKNAVMLRKKLLDYGVEGNVTEIHPGPVITMYEFEPAVGVKINKIVSLADDLAVAMGGKSIRVIPHLPGKAAIGIEIPNTDREIVWLKDIIGGSKFVKSDSKLTVALGKNTQGVTAISDLCKMPHLLIAGATGSGKSVAINAMLCSLLYKARPDEVRLILIDPKTLELPGYNNIPHLLLPVVTRPRDANMALSWALREMEKRYALLSDVGAKNIAGYNAKIEKGTLKTIKEDEAVKLKEENPETIVHTGKLPYIVIVIDELADLMMVSSKEIEENITRLAQMARAAGIHLILATQRPSVDVITGLIKANFPTRIAFKVSSKHDSRTILDGVGAEHLLGQGDMLFMPPNTSNLVRIHGAFVSEAEVERIVKHLKEQGKPCYDESILKPPEKAEGIGDEDYDELYDTAVQIVASSRQASISMIQRKLRIGYNRAARMIERMEMEGIVGPADGSKPREVFVSNIE